MISLPSHFISARTSSDNNDTSTTDTSTASDAGSSRRSSDATMPVGWNHLPAELRTNVLGFATASALQKPKAHHLSAYAAVCREWQVFIEQVNFQSLKVVGADLTNLDDVVTGRRRGWLRHLWLKAELPKYPRKKNRTPETEDEQQANEQVLTRNVQGLFKILRKWNVEECPNGLEFELSARSPSDSQALAGAAGLTEGGDSRYFDSHLDFDFLDHYEGLHGLPLVPVITKVAITRRCWRNFDPRCFLTLISSLPRVAEVRYEPFQQFDDGAQEIIDMDRARSVPFFPETVRRISFFEHFDPVHELKLDNNEDDDGFEDVNGTEAEEEPDPNETEPRTCAALASTLLARSVKLEELSVSFMIDARHFFGPFTKMLPLRQPQLPFWPHLRWLALTTSAIHLDIEPDKLTQLFQIAGRAAKRMPALRALELFNTCKHSAGVFRYAVVGAKAQIVWEATWDYQITDAVTRAWGDVAREHVGARLEVLPSRKFKHDGMFNFIHRNLATRDLIVHPLSSIQMMGKNANIPRPMLKLR